jgi:glycosyltransferase involved in cell wall biosynthesis
MVGFISVIVATRDRQQLLAQTLAALSAQEWPADRAEIIVADNGSTDATRQIVERAAARAGGPPVVYLYVSEAGKSHAVNAALRMARGDLLVFTDDDVIPEPAWLERLAAAVDETDADFVSGRTLPRWEVPPPSWMSPALHGVLAVADGGGQRVLIRNARQGIMPIGANMAARADVVRRVGGLRADLGKLDGTLRSGEDHEFFLRLLHAGCRGVYEPTAVVRHWVPRSRLRRDYVRRWLYQNGCDVARLESVYPSGVRLFRIPRYLWREAASDMLAAVRAAFMLDDRRRFAATTRLIWFCGYLRERWLGCFRPSGTQSLQPAEGR